MSSRFVTNDLRLSFGCKAENLDFSDEAHRVEVCHDFDCATHLR